MKIPAAVADGVITRLIRKHYPDRVWSTPLTGAHSRQVTAQDTERRADWVIKSYQIEIVQ